MKLLTVGVRYVRVTANRHNSPVIRICEDVLLLGKIRVGRRTLHTYVDKYARETNQYQWSPHVIKMRIADLWRSLEVAEYHEKRLAAEEAEVRRLRKLVIGKFPPKDIGQIIETERGKS